MFPEKTTRRIRKVPPFAPLDIVERMVHMSELTEEVWEQFLETNPDNSDLCWAIKRAIIVRERAWQELMKRGAAKEDFLFLFKHLRNRDMLNYWVWEVFKKRDDLVIKDIETILKSKKLVRVVKKEAERLLRSLIKENQRQQQRNEKPEKIAPLEASNNPIVSRKNDYGWQKPWARDWHDPMCG